MLRGSLANFTVSEAIPNSEISMLAMKISLLAEFLTVTMDMNRIESMTHDIHI